jgi:hypothetical protein
VHVGNWEERGPNEWGGGRPERGQGKGVKKGRKNQSHRNRPEPGETRAYVIIAASSNLPTSFIIIDPTLRPYVRPYTASDPWVWVECTVLAAQCLLLLSPQICSIVDQCPLQIPPIAIALALRLLRISVKFSTSYTILHAPFLVPELPPYLHLDPSCFRRTVYAVRYPSLRGSHHDP